MPSRRRSLRQTRAERGKRRADARPQGTRMTSLARCISPNCDGRIAIRIHGIATALQSARCVSAPGTRVPEWCAHAPDHRCHGFGTRVPLPVPPPRAYGSGTPEREPPGTTWGVGHGLGNGLRRRGRSEAKTSVPGHEPSNHGSSANRLGTRTGRAYRSSSSRRQQIASRPVGSGGDRDSGGRSVRLAVEPLSLHSSRGQTRSP